MMTEPTDEQFAAAFYTYNGATGEATPACARRGKQMLAALEAHGCIEKPGLSVRQELVVRLVCAGVHYAAAIVSADSILALGDVQ